MTPASIKLVEFIASLTAMPLRDDLAQSATLALLDTIGSGLYGANQRWGQIVNDLVLSEHTRGKATLYGSARAVAPVHAALANGTATHGFELDDVILGALVHPGCVVVPSALATAEQYGVSGERLLKALVAGYEVTDRVALALGAEIAAATGDVTNMALLQDELAALDLGSEEPIGRFRKRFMPLIRQHVEAGLGRSHA